MDRFRNSESGIVLVVEYSENQVINGMNFNYQLQIFML